MKKLERALMWKAWVYLKYILLYDVTYMEKGSIKWCDYVLYD